MIDLNENFALEEALSGVLSEMAGRPCAVMFSGGFDSMLMVRLAQRSGAKVTGVTVQFEDFNPLTVQESIICARALGIKHQIIPVKAAEFLSAFEKIAMMFDGPLQDLDLAVVDAALKKYDPQIAGDVLISGMGSDQWFGNEALQASGEDLDGLLKKALADEQAHQQVACAYGCQFIFPFLSKTMLDLSLLVPAAMKKDKKLLRSLPVASTIPNRRSKRELQVPVVMRYMLNKVYGERVYGKL